MTVKIDKKKFKKLAEIRYLNSISIYLPGNKDRWIDPLQDKSRLRLKKLLKEITGKLKIRDMDEDAIRNYLKPMVDLVEDDSQWGFLMNGRVIFLNEDYFEHMIIPVKQELYYIGESFYLQPLVPLVNQNQTFYILSIGLKDVELFRCNWFDIEKLEVDKFLPGSLAEALGFDYQEKVTQFRGGQENRGRAMYHGQKMGDEIKKTEVEKFCRYINKGILEILDHRNEKLLIASVDYLFSQYKKINSYPHLEEKNISLSPSKFDARKLHKEAIRILENEFSEEKARKIRAYRESVDRSNVETTVVTAAHEGQIDTLFIDPGDIIWGRFDRDRSQVEVHKDYRKGDISLNNFATIHTFLKNGQVYLMEKEKFPELSRPMNAILRYGI